MMTTGSAPSALVVGWQWLWRMKYAGIAGAVLGAGAGLAWAAASHKVYRAEGVYATQSQQATGGIAGLMSQLSGLTSLSALGMASDSSATSALATLRGANFTARFIHKAGIEKQLIPGGDRPSTDLELIKAFDGNGIRTIIEDRRTGLVTLRIQWANGEQAVKILDAMVEEINEEMRQRALAESRRSVKVLEAELDKSQAIDLRQTINTLIATNLKQAVLADVRRDFALREISAPLVPTERDNIWPRRAMMVLAGIVLGGVVALSIAATMSVSRRKQ